MFNENCNNGGFFPLQSNLATFFFVFVFVVFSN